MQLPNEAVFFEKTILSAAEQAAESEDLMEFFNSAVDTLQTIVVDRKSTRLNSSHPM